MQAYGFFLVLSFWFLTPHFSNTESLFHNVILYTRETCSIMYARSNAQYHTPYISQNGTKTPFSSCIIKHSSHVSNKMASMFWFSPRFRAEGEKVDITLFHGGFLSSYYDSVLRRDNWMHFALGHIVLLHWIKLS